MPNVRLYSRALFEIPSLPNLLKEVKIVPNDTGFGKLLKNFEKNKDDDIDGLPGTISPRTFRHMAFRTQYVKYTTADGMVMLLNARRKKKGLDKPLKGEDLIVAHEYLFPRLQTRLETIGKKNGGLGKARKELVRETDFSTEFISALCKGFRTSEANCKVLRKAAKDLYGADLEYTNDVLDQSVSSIKAVSPTLL